MKQIHCVFIDRDNQREALKAILEGIDNLKSGYSMHIAPEGQRGMGRPVPLFACTLQSGQ
jgi:1-acyl-sn-glycerol-3-phosphate acyltransferase